MAGHSKWAGIKHKKAIVDAKRGRLFTKLARAITVAAKEGGGDPVGNPALGLAIQKAKDASMPKDNIERAIAKGTGAGADVDALENVMYEGYGPGGVALLIEAVTDNRNRTGADVRHALSKGGGSLGEPGSVAYNFDKKGVIAVDGERYSEDDLMVAIDAGAEDISLDDDDHRASAVLGGSQRWCVPKSVLLVAACRGAGIPARLGFSDVRNHLQPPGLAERMGTDLFVWHGYAVLWLDGAWRKASPAFNRELCTRFGTAPLDFDGRSDALLHAYDGQGHRHMEYVRHRGVYRDLPLVAIRRTFADVYGSGLLGATPG